MEIKMLDGSEWIIDGDVEKAIKFKVKKDKQWLDNFKISCSNLFDKRKIIDKYGYEEDWEQKYSTHAEFAPDCSYPFLRVILMGFMFNKLSDKEGKVLAMNSDGSVTEYPSGKKHKNIDDATKQDQEED